MPHPFHNGWIFGGHRISGLKRHGGRREQMRLLTSSAWIPSDGSFPILPVIGIFCLTGAIILAIAAINASRKNKRAKTTPGKAAWTESGRFWQAAYGKLSSFFLTRRFLQSIRGRLEIGSG